MNLFLKLKFKILIVFEIKVNVNVDFIDNFWMKIFMEIILDLFGYYKNFDWFFYFEWLCDYYFFKFK